MNTSAAERLDDDVQRFGVTHYGKPFRVLSTDDTSWQAMIIADGAVVPERVSLRTILDAVSSARQAAPAASPDIPESGASAALYVQEMQRCPVCNGAGTVSRPPWIPGDSTHWTDGGTSTYPCHACDARGYVAPISPPTVLTTTYNPDAARVVELESQLATATARATAAEARAAALTAQRDGLSEIIWWALGERDAFPDPPPTPPPGKPIRRYWWRREMRKRFEAWTRMHVDALMQERRALAHPEDANTPSHAIPPTEDRTNG